uniref:NADH dehydrogenase subunit 6 n=1 Tax=Sinocentrus brevicornis TaxID=3038129 RepID=UPI002551F324|nr:NADH dehydrogenase subunit 6 [Sinocentrus brevicornis]WFD60963.1 NADH dehydrogenase subunit 6 [Sinocentrus brevicornis]
MKIMFMKIIMYFSAISVSMKTPMSMGMMLLMQTLLSISLMNTMNISSWIPMITFLTMIGGLLIIFMYMSSITSNEKFKMNTKMLLPLILMAITMEEMMNEFQNQEMQYMNMISDKMMSMTKMYNKSMMMTLMVILYMLLTMLIVNKIVKMFEGPLRSNTYE